MLKSLTETDFEAALEALGSSPRAAGRVDLIVSRPSPGERVVQDMGELDTVMGLVGDNWSDRRTVDLNCQITLMNSRVIRAIAGEPENWPPADDQLFVDFDLGPDNLLAGQQIAVGTAVLEVTAVPHTGCEQFTERFGHGAIRFVNSPAGMRQRRRGINARVVQSGVVRAGDTISKVE